MSSELRRHDDPHQVTVNLAAVEVVLHLIAGYLLLVFRVISAFRSNRGSVCRRKQGLGGKNDLVLLKSISQFKILTVRSIKVPLA